jgi:dynein heavy chain
MMTMEAVNILLGNKPDWDTAKKVTLSDPQFMDKLKGYDKDNIDDATLKKLRKYTVKEEFEVDSVGRVSKAAKSLCMWCHAMDVYSAVAKEVGPKKAKLDAMNKVLKEATDGLAAKQAELKAVLDKVALLQATCDATIKEKDDLAAEAALTENRLIRANKLTGGLADEGVRWRDTLTHLNDSILQLVGDVFLCAGFISYNGAFTGDFRDMLASSWLKSFKECNLPCAANATLVGTMGDPVEIRGWQLHSLPADPVSIDNALLVTRGKRWPLCIDPQGQAHTWICDMEEEHNLEVTTMANPNMLRSVENCIRVGRPLLFEDCGETLDPSLEPVLARATYKQGGRILIHLGDSDIDYDENFRFYMTTRMSNPHYLPEICIKVTVINFTVTLDGLQDQLLADVVNIERPDVEERKVALLLGIAADKKKLSDIQDEILRSLSASEGNILDDAELIDTLGVAKETAAVIDVRVADAETTQAEIKVTREAYIPVAKRVGLIYFVVADLASIDPMYQYSLEYYTALYRRIVRDAKPSSDFDERLQILLEACTLVMYQNVCRGLFEKDRSLYSSLICGVLLRDRGEILESEWNCLLRGAGAVDREIQEPNPDPERISEFDWDNLWAAEHRIVEERPGDDGEMVKFEPLAGLTTSLSKDWERWLEWIDQDDPLHVPLPCGFAETAGDFQKCILIKIFRGERIINAMMDFVAHHLGKEFAESPQANMQDIYDDLDNKTPCIFVLSSGADPTGMLLRFAKAQSYGERLGIISLGQGQGPRAEALINRGCKTGDWVCLQNCMLAKSWMQDLETIVHGLQKNSEKHNEAFRLYLTSMPVGFFPVFVLQNGVKMTNEPPRGMRANIAKGFDSLISEERYEMFAADEDKNRWWKKLTFGLCFFSALVQERRKFGPLGWNVRYGFDESDLDTSVNVLERFVQEQDEVPWDALNYVTGHINFGGRVTDDWDRRALLDILAIPACPGILTDDYKFSDSGTYYAPPVGSYADLQAYMLQLPELDEPGVFGMHQNADTTYNKNIGAVLIYDMLSLAPRASGGGGGMGPDEQVDQLAKALQAALPQECDLDDAGETTFVLQPNGLLTSLMIVLQQEIVKFNRLLAVMAVSFVDIQKAIEGLILMSQDLDQLYTCFLNNQVPPLWERVSFASMKTLGSWNKDLVFRVAFMQKWLVDGQPPYFPLNLFFFPQGFMTGAVQTFARKYLVPVNKLNFAFEVLDANVSLAMPARAFPASPAPHLLPHVQHWTPSDPTHLLWCPAAARCRRNTGARRRCHLQRPLSGGREVGQRPWRACPV